MNREESTCTHDGGLVPKLRLGTQVRAKLCFGGGPLVMFGRAHGATELRGQVRSQTEFGNEAGRGRQGDQEEAIHKVGKTGVCAWRLAKARRSAAEKLRSFTAKMGSFAFGKVDRTEAFEVASGQRREWLGAETRLAEGAPAGAGAANDVP